MQIPDILNYGLSRAPNRICVAQDETELTFLQVHRRAARAASAMASIGVRPGDKVLLLAANEAEFLELQVACQRIGAAFVPLNFRLALPEIEAICGLCQPRLLVHGPEFADTAASLGIQNRWCLGSADRQYESILKRAELAASDAPAPSFNPEVIAQILFTSGTTGKAKGAIITNFALFSRIAALGTGLKISEHDVFLQTLPLFHLASLVSFAYTALGATCFNVKTFDPNAVLNLLTEKRISHTLTVPTIVQALMASQQQRKVDLSALRTVMYGASPFNPVQLARALDVFGCDFTQLYGMTEAGIAVALEPSDHDPSRRPDLLSAAGRDLPFYRTCIVRPDGKTADVGEVGEVTIESPALLDGYLDDPAATAEAVRSGRMHTGDAGYRDANGYLFLTDRIKDMIITGGENVYCREVEAVLLECPEIADAAVLGLPDEQWGQRVHAIIVAKAGASSEHAILDKWCRARLAGYKCPRSYENIDVLPRNAVGKVLKHVLRSSRIPSRR